MKQKIFFSSLDNAVINSKGLKFLLLFTRSLPKSE